MLPGIQLSTRARAIRLFFPNIILLSKTNYPELQKLIIPNECNRQLCHQCGDNSSNQQTTMRAQRRQPARKQRRIQKARRASSVNDNAVASRRGAVFRARCQDGGASVAGKTGRSNRAADCGLKRSGVKRVVDWSTVVSQARSRVRAGRCAMIARRRDDTRFIVASSIALAIAYGGFAHCQ